MDRYLKSDDERFLFEPKASIDAEELLTAARIRAQSDSIPSYATGLVATLHWFRYLNPPGGNGHEEQLRAFALGSLTYLDERPLLAPSLVQELEEQLGSSPMSAAEAWSRLASDVMSEAWAKGDSNLIAVAIEILRRSLNQADPGSSVYAQRADNLAGFLTLRYQVEHNSADLKSAIDVCESALRSVSSRSDIKAFQSRLGELLVLRYQQQPGSEERLADLDRAIEALCVSLGYPTGDDARICHNIGDAYQHRFEFTSDPEDLERAIEFSGRALTMSAEDDENIAAFEFNYGNCLHLRFDRYGDIRSLLKAIEIYESALKKVPSSNSLLIQIVNNIASALASRFDLVHDRADLDQAIGLCTMIDKVYADISSRSSTPAAVMIPLTICLTNLATFLMKRYRLFRSEGGQFEDLDRASRLFDQLVNAQGQGDQVVGAILGQGQALRLRAIESGNYSDWSEAIAIFQRACDRATTNSRPWRLGLTDLGLCLTSRYRISKTMSDLENALKAHSDALDSIPIDHPDIAMCKSNLASVLWIRYTVHGKSEDASEAFKLWKAAVQDIASSAHLRIDAAESWGDAAASSTLWREEAIEAYSNAVSLLPAVAWSGLRRIDRDSQLERWTGLAEDAAACAIAAEKCELALDLLERGRGMFWREMLEYGSLYDRLRLRDPVLAARMQSLRSLMLSDDNDIEGAQFDLTIPNGERAAGYSGEATRRMERALEWEACIKLAEQTMENDEEPRTLANLVESLPPNCCVIVLNVSPIRCDALKVTSNGVELLRNVRFVYSEVFARCQDYLRSIQNYEQSPTDAIFRAEFDREIWDILTWVWLTIIQPILSDPAIAEMLQNDTYPRLWWCPTGPMTLLPVHAAGIDGGQSALDSVVSSYTPTLTALFRAIGGGTRPGSADHTQHEQLLHVAIENVPGGAPLPGVRRDVALLDHVFSDNPPYRLSEGMATRGIVAEILDTYKWLHFSCHGTQELSRPASGGLLLYDGILRIGDIASTSQNPGKLVFLGACKTGTGGVRISGEVMSVAAAFRYAGWQEVIGTLWSVDDDSATRIAEVFYNLVVDHGQMVDLAKVPFALNSATRALRSKFPHSPSRWAFFVHYGS